MELEKLTGAIASAMGYLEDAMKVESKGNDEDLSGLVWRAAADLEYALFLFSILRQDESESSSWKLGPHSKEVEIDSFLASAKGLLEEAESKIKAGEFREAHKRVWLARGHLLRLQGFFEKEKEKPKKVAKNHLDNS